MTRFKRYLLMLLCLFPRVWSITEFNIEDFQGQADITFVIDGSGSIRENNIEGKDNWEELKSFIKDMVRSLPMGDEGANIAIIKYSTNVETVYNLDSFTTHDQLIRAIDNLNYTGGNTNTAGALREMRTNIFTPANGDRPNARNIGVLITDGVSNVNPTETITEARRAKEENIQLFTVGVSDYVNVDELQEMSSDPIWYHHFLSPDFAHLNVLQEKLVSRVAVPKLPPLARCDARADVVFILDNSGSIRQKNPKDMSYDNWQLLKDFVSHVIESFDIAFNMTRVAVIKYAAKAELGFYLNTYENKSDMLARVQSLDYVSGGTNTSGALRLMRRDILTVPNGDRPDVRNVAIVISDGESTIEESNTTSEAQAAKKDGIEMYVVGLTSLRDEKELVNISSDPISEHYFNSTDIAHAKTLVNRLVMRLCDKECPLAPTGDVEHLEFVPAGQHAVKGGEGVGSSGCRSSASQQPSFCNKDQQPVWEEHEHRILVGHNYLRLPYIHSAEECQHLCQQQSECRSIDYTPEKQECAVSHVGKDMVPESYAEDPDTYYYELVCKGGEIDHPNPVNPGGIGEIDIESLFKTSATSTQPYTDATSTTQTSDGHRRSKTAKKTTNASPKLGIPMLLVSFMLAGQIYF